MYTAASSAGTLVDVTPGSMRLKQVTSRSICFDCSSVGVHVCLLNHRMVVMPGS